MLSISAMIYEPSEHILEFLAKTGFSLDGDADCLPRRSINELRYALSFMVTRVFIVRSSVLQGDAELSEVVFNLHSQGVDIVVVQDTELKLNRTTTSFGNLHFVSNVGGVNELRRLIVVAHLKSISRNSQRSTLL